MRTTTLLVSLLMISLATPVVPAPAQTVAEDDRWQVATESGDYIWDIRLVRLSGDSLVFRKSDSLGTVQVQQIREMRLIRKTTMRVGEAGGGSALAALTGADDEVYDFQTLDFPARLRAIQQILLVHPPKT
jgi:hypothetical protein